MIPTVGQSSGFFISGNKLLPECETKDFERICMNYIMGVVDTVAVVIFAEKGEDFFCINSGVNSDQLRRVFINYANKYPEELHKSASAIVVNAIIEKFPCK